MTPTNTITDGTSLPLLGGTTVFFNFTTKPAPARTLPTDQKGVGDPTAPSFAHGSGGGAG
jgi:hypothetical protein